MPNRRSLFLYLLACTGAAFTAYSAEPAKISYRTIMAPDGVPLNVVETGPADGIGILFIHGVGQSHASWDRQFYSDLALTFHLVAFDLRGHGGSGKPWKKESYNQACIWADDVAAVIAATGLTRPVMVVWSYGGTIGMDYVRCRGTEKLSGLLFAAARSGLYPNADVNPRIPMASEKLKAPDLAQNIEGSTEFTAFLTASPLPEDIKSKVSATNLMYPPYARQANDGAKLLPDGSIYKNNEDLIPSLQLPLFFALGEKDAFSSAKSAAMAIKARFPESEVVTYQGAGHWLFFEAAAPFNRDLARFATHAVQDRR